MICGILSLAGSPKRAHPPIFVAQIMGHSSPNILQTYVKAIDEFRRSAILKLENLREIKTAGHRTTPAKTPQRVSRGLFDSIQELESPWHSYLLLEGISSVVVGRRLTMKRKPSSRTRLKAKVGLP